MSGKQQQIQRPKPPKQADAPSDAPTVNRKIAKLWFAGQ